jgi:putative ABC transport system permease protein
MAVSQSVLKGGIAKGFKGSRMRNILVVFQFAISIMLIIGTLVIYSQLNYIRNKDLGFNRQQVLVIKNTRVLNTQIKAFKDELQKINGVTGVTVTGYMPVNGNRNNDAYFTSPVMDARTAISLQTWYVDKDYIPTFDMKLIKGRNFSEQFSTDSGAIVINEAASLFLGANGQVNKTLYSLTDIKVKTLVQRHIIGIIKNFNFNSLRDVITPLALFLGKDNGSIAVRVNNGNIPNALAQVKSKWESFAPSQSFDYAFMDEEFNSLYDTEQRTGKIFISFAILAIVIACLGLFGLAAYAAEQRIREIGIRKVLGATATTIVSMLSTDFLKLVIIAAIIAFPLAWWVMHKWLQDFAYRVGISWWIFALAGIAALFIALITVCYQALKAALTNPVKSLRTE